MSESTETRRPAPALRWAWTLILAGLAAVTIWAPGEVLETFLFVADSLVCVAPLVGPGILLAAWINASGAGSIVAGAFGGRVPQAILMASAIGAITPVCGVTVLPLMTGLLAAGVPLAPIMAFWLASPITDPAMLAATGATLGFGFALGKTLAALGLGLLGGFATAALSPLPWTHAPLRQSRFLAGLGGTACGSSVGFQAAVWANPERRAHLFRELRAMTRLILICLIPAFAAEHVLNGLLQPEALTPYVGAEAWWAIPLAVFVGAPAYIDGYAALPLTRALMEHGMSPGTAMAFLVSGGVVSIWGAMAIAPILRIGPFALYLTLAVTGSLCAGWLYEFVA